MEKRERGGGDVEHRGHWEDPLATRFDKENELSQTNRGIRGGCVGVVPRVQSKLSRALHTHRGKKLLQDLQNVESKATKRAMIRFRGAREKGTIASVECLAFSQEDTMALRSTVSPMPNFDQSFRRLQKFEHLSLLTDSEALAVVSTTRFVGRAFLAVGIISSSQAHDFSGLTTCACLPFSFVAL